MTFFKHKTFNMLSPLSCVVIVGLLIGCDTNIDKKNIVKKFKGLDTEKMIETAENNQPEIQGIQVDFVGCYSVVEGGKAQIKLSEMDENNKSKLALQMKESTSKKRVWDDKDALERVDLSEAGVYFDINVSHIDGMVAREDRLFVLAHVNTNDIQMKDTEGKGEFNGIINSEYLVYFSDGSDNTNTESQQDNKTASIKDDTVDSKGIDKHTEVAKNAETKPIKNIPAKPQGNVIYRVECDDKKVNIIKKK